MGKIIYPSFEKHLVEQLKNPEFKRYYNEYKKQVEVAYQVLRLRKMAKMSQIELAEKMGTKQSNVARLEAGQQNFTVDTLQKIAGIFGRSVEIKFVK